MCVCAYVRVRVHVRVGYLQVRELPGLVVVLGAGLREGLSEIHLDQLPVGAVADVSKHTGNSKSTTSANHQEALCEHLSIMVM